MQTTEGKYGADPAVPVGGGDLSPLLSVKVSPTVPKYGWLCFFQRPVLLPDRRVREMAKPVPHQLYESRYLVQNQDRAKQLSELASAFHVIDTSSDV